MAQVQAGSSEGTGKYIVGYIGPQIPDMGIVVYRRPAAVEAGFPRDKGLESL
jgi:hypothetical protein